MIWYVEVGALVIGHVAGLAVAHDRAVGLFRSPRLALWAQYPMLVLMILFTIGGLWVLSPGMTPGSLAHGGIPGLIAETSIVIVALVVFGYFIRRSAKKEQERERTKPGRVRPRRGLTLKKRLEPVRRLLRIRPRTTATTQHPQPTGRQERSRTECARHGHSCCWRSSEQCSQRSSSVASAPARRTRPATARRL